MKKKKKEKKKSIEMVRRKKKMRRRRRRRNRIRRTKIPCGGSVLCELGILGPVRHSR